LGYPLGHRPARQPDVRANVVPTVVTPPPPMSPTTCRHCQRQTPRRSTSTTSRRVRLRQRQPTACIYVDVKSTRPSTSATTCHVRLRRRQADNNPPARRSSTATAQPPVNVNGCSTSVDVNGQRLCGHRRRQRTAGAPSTVNKSACSGSSTVKGHSSRISPPQEFARR
jgi:hypothetical protein